ncbi:MAG: ORF6N domain-containing protein [Flavobacteriales bacterium]|nr:ORF6N domain-containing protein [Flavobacteriales bacterium]MBK6945293.1 ORF6N domain-containing protein [Flavobacteriales bacterium]MBK7239643.1 ORF6N domain-containing protein [Flavobacteriales bacterium]MBK7298306.1 ORF6N domain-containing protein [Flavobacteriales bacterium]MBK9535150.1 ORF6N domain-containing protein [Flavobacteriales bacterium]
MLDRNLAELYDVPTKALKQAVRRNLDRFPDDFMFEMNKEEFEHGAVSKEAALFILLKSRWKLILTTRFG